MKYYFFLESFISYFVKPGDFHPMGFKILENLEVFVKKTGIL